MTTIIGIDPGSRNTGYGVITCDGNQFQHITSGTLHTQNDDLSTRLYTIHQGICDVIAQFQPQEASIEQVFVHQNVQSALKLGQARGAAIVALSSLALPLAEYAPRLVKQAIVGYGAAQKQQVQHMVQILLQLQETPAPDAADALAIAICHANLRGRDISKSRSSRGSRRRWRKLPIKE